MKPPAAGHALGLGCRDRQGNVVAVDGSQPGLRGARGGSPEQATSFSAARGPRWCLTSAARVARTCGPHATGRSFLQWNTTLHVWSPSGEGGCMDFSAKFDELQKAVADARAAAEAAATESSDQIKQRI